MKKFIVLAAMLVCVGMQNFASAQVAVGPGFFEAPYVRLEWNRGGLHVQAPFVDIHTSKWHCPDTIATPGVPNLPPQPAAIAPSLPERLYSAGRELKKALDRFDTGATWQRYLGLSTGGALATVPIEHRAGQYMYPSSDAADVARLRRHFQTVSRDERYRMIADLPTFQTTYRLLIEFLDQPIVPPQRAEEELPAPNDPTIQDDRPRPQD